MSDGGATLPKPPTPSEGVRTVPADKGAAAAAARGPKVRAQLAQDLRRMIIDGVYQPGDRMTERELCARLGASRPSVREALRQLEAEGLIDILPNRGPVVKAVSLAELLEIWEVRSALEVLIARRFALNGTEPQVAQFEQAIGRLGAALAAGDVELIKSSKAHLYEAQAAGANSATLASYFGQLNARLSFLWSSSLILEGRPAESVNELNALLAAIRSRNPVAAEAAALQHIDHRKAVAIYGLRAFEEARRSGKAKRPPRRPAELH